MPAPNYSLTNPATLFDRVAALELNALSGNPIADQALLGSRVLFNPLATPAAPTIVTVGGSATTQAYKIVAKLGTGYTAASPAGTQTAGPTTLDATHYNTLTWTAVPGATSYDVYRTTGGAAQGLIANVIATGAATYSLVDNGLVATVLTAPSIGTSGVLVAPIQYFTTVYAADGAINAAGLAVITKGTAAALTLAAPVAGVPAVGGMDGLLLSILSTTAAAHTVTAPSNKINGGSAVITFSAAIANNATLRAYNGIWYVMGSTGATLS